MMGMNHTEKNMIKYLNDAANNIQYTNKDGELVTRNPFDPDFVLIAQRLSLIHSNEAENQQRRTNYENAVRAAQVSVDAGRFAPVALPVPYMLVTPEDYTLPADEQSDWDPPLLEIKHRSGVPVPDTHGFGPDSPYRNTHPVVATVADMTGPAQNSLQSVLGLLTTIGPALPSLIDFLESLFNHHRNSTPK